MLKNLMKPPTETSDEEVFEHASNFWCKLRKDLEKGVFWTDEIKRLRDNPAQRLSMALQNLPLPGAYREAAIALRAIIREERKTQKPYEKSLKALYWLAGMDSFRIDYAENAKCPGYNVVEIIPQKVTKTMIPNYRTLGYTKLPLLNKTDVKWMIELWNEPESHYSLHEVYKNIWDEYERKLMNNYNNKNRTTSSKSLSQMLGIKS